MALKKRGTLFIISAPTGGGKTSLINEVLPKLKKKHAIERVTTYTTRKPREGEKCGKDYHFVSPSDFGRLSLDGKFLEANYFFNNWYATPNSIFETLSSGTSLILITDWQGAQKLKDLQCKPVLIWIKPPTEEILESRLATRGTEIGMALQLRQEEGIAEMKKEEKIKLFPQHLVNNDFKVASRELIKLLDLHISHL